MGSVVLRLNTRKIPWYKEEDHEIEAKTTEHTGQGGPASDHCQWLTDSVSFPATLTVEHWSATEILFYKVIQEAKLQRVLIPLPSLRVLELSTGSSVSRGRTWKESKSGGP